MAHGENSKAESCSHWPSVAFGVQVPLDTLKDTSLEDVRYHVVMSDHDSFLIGRKHMLKLVIRQVDLTGGPEVPLEKQRNATWRAP